MTCEGDADDNLKWLKPDGSEVDFNSKSRVFRERYNGTLRLVIKQITTDDQGEWTCVSNFDDGGDGKSFMMNVYGRHFFQVSNEVYNF